jgi:hypothetical protein
MRVGRLRAVLGSGVVLAAAAAGLLLPGASAQPLAPNALTPAERAALRITSVRAQGAEGAGITVTVTFAGNLEKAIGRGHLQHAVVAVILRPKDDRFATADLATEGPGAIGLTSKKTRSSSVGVVRKGKVFTFFIVGPGSSNVGTAVAKTFASAPGRKPARRTAGTDVSPDQWERIENDIATSEAIAGIDELTIDKLDLNCDKLREWYDRVLEDLARARLHKADLQDLRKQIDGQIASAEAKITKHSSFTTALLKGPNKALDAALTLLGGAPRDRMYTWQDVVRNLKLDRRLVDTYDALNDKVIERFLELKGRIEGLHKAKCNTGGTAPPPPTTKTYDVGLKGSYMHNGDTSTVCVRVKTSPAQPSAAAQVKVTGPGVIKNGEQSKELDTSGQALADVPINVRGLYTVTATVTAHGETETASTTVDVKVAPATCPPPP